MNLPTTAFGRNGPTVTRLGLGGEGILRTFGREHEARAVIEAALDCGVTYCESARAYSGSESYYGSVLGSRRERLFLATKVHERSKRAALASLQTSLRALGTDVIDLWQIHDVRQFAELDELESEDGAYAAATEARERGLIRFIGVTGHHEPDVLLAALERFSFDSVLLPINPAEGAHRDAFERSVVPAARARGMAVIGMKVLARGLLLGPRGAGLTLDEALGYALSADVDTLVVGCDDPAQVRASAAAAAAYRGMAADQRRELEQRVAPYANRLAYYRGTAGV